METKQKFKVFCPTIIKSVDEDNQDDLILEGVATTTGVDLEGDFITQDCIESLKEQILPLNIHMSHGKSIDSVVGSVLEVIKTDDDSLKIKFVVLPKFRKEIEELLDYGVNLGLSIRGKALDYEKTDSGLKVKQIKLLEVSLTPLPANWETFGTVTKSKGLVTSQCFNGACMQLVKDMSTDIEQSQVNEEGSESTSLGKQEVIDLINEAFSNFEDRIITYFESEYRINDLKQLLQQTSTTASDEELEEKPETKNEDILSQEPVDEESEEDEEVDEEETKKSLEETETTDEGIKEMTEEIEKTEQIEEQVVDKVVEETPIVKEFDVDDVVKSITEKIGNDEELIKSICEKVSLRVTEELAPQLSESVTENILKDLSANREPKSVEIPKIDLEKEEQSNEPMNRFEIAKALARRE